MKIKLHNIFLWTGCYSLGLVGGIYFMKSIEQIIVAIIVFFLAMFVFESILGDGLSDIQ